MPHGIMGISTSDIVPDSTGGQFGPFAGQLLVGDQGHSKITRVFLERIEGVYQGAAFPFLEGFSSGVLRMAWARDGALFVGMTSRGWASTGRAPFGLQRATWTGALPFEVSQVQSHLGSNRRNPTTNGAIPWTWWVMSENLPSSKNRVTASSSGHITVRWRPNNLVTHQRQLRQTKRIMRRAGYQLTITETMGIATNSHQCGTLRMGQDPAEIVVNPWCRTHDVANLYVVDASIFPSSAAMNPALTIAAQALKFADHLKQQNHLFQ